MNFEFNFTGLKDIYNNAVDSFDKTLLFELEINKGRFLFMMFLSEEDVESLDLLFVYLRNINQIVQIKLYGNHRKGDFKVYLKPDQIRLIIEELKLGQGSIEFDFSRLINQMNNMMPKSISPEEKLTQMRENKTIMNTINPVDEPNKSVLIGTKRVPQGQTPRDKTLRKLYLYTEGSSNDIEKIIELLKKVNHTVAWTTEDKRKEAKSINKLISDLG
ncbi:hypothetical protein [Paenibacillus paridis]|uniref:hypothetical protein n=1 Tax=Paenibacillus paridis TaxID=2583376 RepID=UPI001123AEA7|nr:hypothetical protein [Paenibacillus paridis]